LTLGEAQKGRPNSSFAKAGPINPAIQRQLDYSRFFRCSEALKLFSQASLLLFSTIAWQSRFSRVP